MPYIKPADRHVYTCIIEACERLLTDKSSGELNYLLTSIAHAYIKSHGTSYKTYNEVIGVFECAKLEMYRRHTSPYEDLKCSENGDVPDR